MKTNYIKPFPIAEPDEETHEKIITLSKNLHEANKTLYNPSIKLSGTEKNQYIQEKELLFNKLNRVIYELYGLTDDEIKIVEGKNG